MTTAMELTEGYISARDLRADTKKIYRVSAKLLTEYFGTTPIEQIDHLAVLAWRKHRLENDLGKRSWNTYSSHLRTVWSFAIEHGLLTHTSINPFKKTSLIPPKRGSKTVDNDAIKKARNWLNSLVGEERCTNERSQITPAWFWLSVFEVFYYTGIRLSALLHLRYKDIDLAKKMIRIRGETEKTHREFSVPIMEGLAPHLSLILDQAKKAGFRKDDQLFNVNRFSRHYHGKEMNIDQVEAMYRKLTDKTGVRMTPHRFRHTIATDLMKHPERNIHLTKSLLNHSNIATTMNYIEVDYDHMRAALHERSLVQGALSRVRWVDSSGTIPTTPVQGLLEGPEMPERDTRGKPSPHHGGKPLKVNRSTLQQALELASAMLHRGPTTPATNAPVAPTDQHSALQLIAQGLGLGSLMKKSTPESPIGPSYLRASP